MKRNVIKISKTKNKIYYLQNFQNGRLVSLSITQNLYYINLIISYLFKKNKIIYISFIF